MDKLYTQSELCDLVPGIDVMGVDVARAACKTLNHEIRNDAFMSFIEHWGRVLLAGFHIEAKARRRGKVVAATHKRSHKRSE